MPNNEIFEVNETNDRIKDTTELVRVEISIDTKIDSNYVWLFISNHKENDIVERNVLFFGSF